MQLKHFSMYMSCRHDCHLYSLSLILTSTFVKMQVVAQSGQPGAATSGSGILGHADRILRKKTPQWVKDLIPELEEKAAVGCCILQARKSVRQPLKTRGFCAVETPSWPSSRWFTRLCNIRLTHVCHPHLTGGRVWQLCRSQPSDWRKGLGICSSLRASGRTLFLQTTYSLLYTVAYWCPRPYTDSTNHYIR